jgi:hypothetical protein
VLPGRIERLRVIGPVHRANNPVLDRAVVGASWSESNEDISEAKHELYEERAQEA